MIRLELSALLLGLSLGAQAAPADDAALADTVARRVHGDRSGACVAVAVIDQTVSRAVVCADPKHPRTIDLDTAFEIGSVSKTFTGVLLAELVAAGTLRLDDPLQRFLPTGVSAPAFEGQAITLRHLLTHTSGLPSFPPGWPVPDPRNPYRAVDEAALFAALGKATLTRAPGSRFEYANFGAMLLSWVVSQAADKSFDALVAERVFRPLGMRHSFVGDAPTGVALAPGHLPNGSETPGWEFDARFAGVGGIRASLNDMVRYVEGQLGRGADDAVARLRAGQQVVDGVEGRPMAWGWMLAPLNGQQIHVHEGGTGGYSSFVGFDAARQRGVVVLSDTALSSLGGLGSLALHLLDETVPLGAPRTVATPSVELLDQLAGDWLLEGGLRMSLRRKGQALEIQAAGQPAFVMGYDSAGDFYPLAFDALLRPQGEGERLAFVWMQGGGAVPARRVDAAPAVELDAKTLDGYAGSYPLMPGFALKVFVEDGGLKAQATGQGAFALQAADKDVFRADAFGIEIRFARGVDGAVNALALKQGGQTLQGPRQ